MDPLWLLAIGMLIVVGGILGLRLHAFLALILGAYVVGSLTTTPMLERYAQHEERTPEETRQLLQQSTPTRIANGFGETCAKIGILIGMASIIGICLLESGAAEKIIRSMMRFMGEQRTALAFLFSGFTLGIPVFFDTVFYLLIPLGKASTIRAGKNYVLYILAIVAGATMAHSLVPPTPGPIFVAEAMKVRMDQMILGGLVIGLFTACAGYVYALLANRLFHIPLRDTADISSEELTALSQKPESELPSLWISLLPIVLPVVLIAGNTCLTLFITPNPDSAVMTALLGWSRFLGDKNTALSIAALCAMLTVVCYHRRNRGHISAIVQNALSGAGVIILITASGGAFGAILQQTGIAVRIQELSEIYRVSYLLLGFGVTALVRTAQGSATVAMVTAAGILSGFADPELLGYHPLYLALAIGCGSKPILWMNDSGFWIMCKMTGMKESETLKTVSVMMIVMSLVGLIVIMILSSLFPMVETTLPRS